MSVSKSEPYPAQEFIKYHSSLLMGCLTAFSLVESGDMVRERFKDKRVGHICAFSIPEFRHRLQVGLLLLGIDIAELELPNKIKNMELTVLDERIRQASKRTRSCSSKNETS